MLRYAAKNLKNSVQQVIIPKPAGLSQKLLVTVAWRLATRSVGPTHGRQRGGVYHYHTPKHA